MTGLPFFIGNANPGLRTLCACLDSVEAQLTERALNLDQLVQDTVTGIDAHPQGICFRFATGAAIVVSRGAIFDAAGLPVIEPASPSNPRPLQFEPGQPAAAPFTVHERGGGAFGDLP